MREIVCGRGYKSADFAELIAFASQHSSLYARKGNLFVDVLEPAPSGKYPTIWYGSDSLSSAHLEIGFNSEWDYTNHEAGAEFTILVKKL